MDENNAKDPSRRIHLPAEGIVSQVSLTANDRPCGWRFEAEDDSPPEYEQLKAAKLPKLKPPGNPSRGLAKLWRFARTFINLLRRPVVVNDLPIHLQMESTDACNLNCTTCSRDIFVEKARLLEEEIWKKVIVEIRPTNINVSGIG